MKTPEQLQMDIKKNYFSYGLLITAFLLFLILRIISFLHVEVVEDHDSVSIMRTIEVFQSGDLMQIIHMDPDRSLMYGFTGALISIAGWSLEHTARMVSMFSSIGIFFICYFIAKRFYSKIASITGLFLLALTPALIGLSISVLTEPLYVFIVYLGLYLFIEYHKNLKLIPAFCIGIVFGFSFLTRLEGILFMVLIPLLMAIYLFIEDKFRSDIKPYLSWSGVFLSGFLLIAAIQVSWASYNMGTLAVDGRQVWSYLLNEPGDASNSERIYGLRYSDEVTNAVFLKNNPGRMISESQAGLANMLIQYSRTVRININDLYSNRLANLVGIVTLIFFALGIIRLYKAGRIFEIILVFLFMITGLIAPLLHNVVIRHIMVIAPIIIVVAGIGLYSSLTYIMSEMDMNKYYKYSIIFLIISLIMSVWVTSLPATLKGPAVNREYDPAAIQQLANVLNEKYESADEIVFSANKRYLQLFTDAQIIFAPFCEYDLLVHFLKANNVNYLLLNHELQWNYPYVEQFNNESYGDYFNLIQDLFDRHGQRLTLYRFDAENI